MIEYQGHHCWNCWNVALWLANDEPLYRAALAVKARCRSLTVAANVLRRGLPNRTPDGARYTTSALRRALADLE